MMSRSCHRDAVVTLWPERACYQHGRLILCIVLMRVEDVASSHWLAKLPLIEWSWFVHVDAPLPVLDTARRLQVLIFQAWDASIFFARTARDDLQLPACAY